MRIAVIDYRVVRSNPIGGCHLRMIAGLCAEHQFTVFAPEFENPAPDRIEWVRVRVPKRPLAILFVAFHLLAPFYYWLYCLRHRARFDVVQIVESNLSFGDVSYSQFCHRAFLRDHWSQIGSKGFRGACRWLDHYLHALLEPFVYRRMKRIVVPSAGLARELSAEYPLIANKIHILPNPVDTDRTRRPADFDRDAFRTKFGFAETDVVLLFSALGHFERKGLPVLLSALRELANQRIKVLVVGGQTDLIKRYEAITSDM